MREFKYIAYPRECVFHVVETQCAYCLHLENGLNIFN